VKFIYPPTSLLFVDAVRAVAPNDALQAALNFVSWCLVWLTALLTAWLADRELTRAGHPAADALDRGLRLGLVCALTLGFYPVVKAYTLGQMQVVVNAAFAGFLLCWVSDRRAGAGALAVLMAAVKPQYGALLLWGLVRREWGFVRGATLTGAVLLLLSIVLYGFASHVDYLSVVAHVGRLGEAYWPNQTINGLLQRALGNGNSAVWDPEVYPPYHVGIHAATWSSTLLVIGLACLGRAKPRGSALDAAAVVLAATFASPIAWEHHYGVLPPLFVVMVFPCLVHFGRRGALLLAGGFLLASQYWHVLDALTDTSWNALQSLLLFVGLGLFVALLWLRAAGPPETEASVRDS
jgi:hypothetical protein